MRCAKPRLITRSLRLIQVMPSNSLTFQIGVDVAGLPRCHFMSYYPELVEVDRRRGPNWMPV
jgi:hypothetical protein